MMTDQSPVLDEFLYEQHDGYAVVTINRPRKRNAVNAATQQALLDVLSDDLSGNRAIILTGAGNVAFCAGVDITERSNLGANPTPRRRASEWDSWLLVQDAISRCPMVVIAAINGYALGGGVTLVNSCDLAIASDHVEFGIPELNAGIIPALSGPSTLAHLPKKVAAYLVFAGVRMDAPTAQTWGLVNEVCSAEAVLPRCHELAIHVAALDGEAVDFTKKLLRDCSTTDTRTGMEHGLALGAVLKSHRTAQPMGPPGAKGT